MLHLLMTAVNYDHDLYPNPADLNVIIINSMSWWLIVIISLGNGDSVIPGIQQPAFLFLCLLALI